MSDAPTYRVVLADDHAVLRSGLRALLDAEPDLEVVGEAADGALAFALAERLRPDVLVLDVEMPGLSGPDVAERLRAAGLAVRVLVLSAHRTPAHLARLAASGVAGFVTKELPPAVIVEAVRAVARGEQRWFVRPPAAPASAALSDRERDVLRLLADGASNAGIASGLRVSENTVRNHLVSIYEKLGVDGAREAIAWAYKNGVVSVRG